MTASTIYINQLPRKSEAFSIEIQGLEYILEVFRIIAEVENNFAKDMKERATESKLAFLKKS